MLSRYLFLHSCMSAFALFHLEVVLGAVPTLFDESYSGWAATRHDLIPTGFHRVTLMVGVLLALFVYPTPAQKITRHHRCTGFLTVACIMPQCHRWPSLRTTTQGRSIGSGGNCTTRSERASGDSVQVSAPCTPSAALDLSGLPRLRLCVASLVLSCLLSICEAHQSVALLGETASGILS